MSLFNSKKQKEQNSDECCCSGNCCENAANTATENSEGALNESRVKVLGSGCQKCNELEANAKEALKQMCIDIPVEKVTDFAVIAAYGVMTTPALVINEKVVSYGKVLKAEEIKKLIEKFI